MSSALATPEVVATPKPLADITPDIAQRSQAGGKAARYIRSTAWRIAKPSIAIAIFLGIWEAAPRLGLVDKVFLPPFTEVVSAFFTLAENGQLQEHVSASLTRALTGFFVA
ncbi:MAG: ABC transporter permease, partial [Rhodococcus qingshengii]